jgi:hypothetical protein
VELCGVRFEIEGELERGMWGKLGELGGISKAEEFGEEN